MELIKLFFISFSTIRNIISKCLEKVRLNDGGYEVRLTYLKRVSQFFGVLGEY